MRKVRELSLDENEGQIVLQAPGGFYMKGCEQLAVTTEGKKKYYGPCQKH